MRSTFLPILLASCTVQGTDLLVATGGAGNVHPNITAAHAAAMDGDRILVTPGTYNENPVITKGVEILCNSATQRFTVNGSLSFQPAAGGRTATCIGMVLTGDVGDNGASANGPSMLRLVGCRVNKVYSIAHAVRYYLAADSVMSGITAVHLDLFGSWIKADASTGTTVYLFGATSTTSISRLTGNEFVANPATPNTLLQLDATTPVRVENNLIKLGTLGGALFISNTSSTTSVPCTFINNTIIRTANGSWTLVHVAEDASTYMLDVRNNFSVAPIAPSMNLAGSGVSQGFNTHSASFASLNTTTGALIAGSPAINAGDQDVAYTDLDLSRNDTGCYGGSLSRDNFDDALPTTAFISLVNAPRRTQATATVTFTVDGIDR